MEGKKYILKTESGSFYEVIDESHLFAPDTWMLMKNGKRHVILSFGKFRQMIPNPNNPFGGPGQSKEVKIRNLQGGVGNNIANGTCIGHSVFYIPENLVAPYMKKRNIPPAVWNNVISKHYGNTTKVKEIYMKIH
jgi:hypothetical protein